MSDFKLTPAHYKKFFAQMNKVTSSLGLDSRAAEQYYRKVLLECAGVHSIKLIKSKAGYDACLLRFSSEAGDFATALDYEIERVKRLAYVIKVTVLQIMQLAKLDEHNARAYFEAVVSQARRGAIAGYSGGESFYLDIPQCELLLFVKILDTHLRRLKKRYFPLFPIAFNDRVRYVFAGSCFLREDVDRYYYANQPFTVRAS